MEIVLLDPFLTIQCAGRCVCVWLTGNRAPRQFKVCLCYAIKQLGYSFTCNSSREEVEGSSNAPITANIPVFSLLTLTCGEKVQPEVALTSRMFLSFSCKWEIIEYEGLRDVVSTDFMCDHAGSSALRVLTAFNPPQTYIITTGKTRVFVWPRKYCQGQAVGLFPIDTKTVNCSWRIKGERDSRCVKNGSIQKAC